MRIRVAHARARRGAVVWAFDIRPIIASATGPRIRRLQAKILARQLRMGGHAARYRRRRAPCYDGDPLPFPRVLPWLTRKSAPPRSSITGSTRPARSRSPRPSSSPTSATSALAYTPGVAAACDEIVRDPRRGAQPHRARQPGRRRHQRHGGARPRRDRPAGREAGDGRQGGAVQEVRRHRLLRHRDRRARPRQAGRHHRRARADVRRHQPRGHQGARVLLRRAEAAASA